MESSTYIRQKPTAAKVGLQSGAMSSPPPETGTKINLFPSYKIRVWLMKAPLLGRNEEAWKSQPDYPKQELIQPYDGCISSALVSSERSRQRKPQQRHKKLGALLALTTLHLLQQQRRGQNLHIGRQMSHRHLHLLLNPVREVQVWRKHSVRACVAEDPGMPTDRQHDSSYAGHVVGSTLKAQKENPEMPIRHTDPALKEVKQRLEQLTQKQW
ncbi:hypothetical protein CRENBAI_004402 [Crenichthys baileyi]|uniref:Uncharacterized protein n=1 Tax=Crenichthys baileyi TaxID=28760 RepID=A0AAV9RGG2_9TELE